MLFATRQSRRFVEGQVEPDERYFRRRASEELAAARRAVTDEARERRLTLAGVFLDRLKAVEADCLLAD
jgi:hypothetical protein